MGTFHRVDADASGTVALEHLADCNFAVVFEDFTIASADHTNVILVANSDVTKSADIDQTMIVDHWATFRPTEARWREPLCLALQPMPGAIRNSARADV